jgi:hypothetical protein
LSEVGSFTPPSNQSQTFTSRLCVSYKPTSTSTAAFLRLEPGSVPKRLPPSRVLRL